MNWVQNSFLSNCWDIKKQEDEINYSFIPIPAIFLYSALQLSWCAYFVCRDRPSLCRKSCRNVNALWKIKNKNYYNIDLKSYKWHLPIQAYATPLKHTFCLLLKETILLLQAAIHFTCFRVSFALNLKLLSHRKGEKILGHACSSDIFNFFVNQFP